MNSPEKKLFDRIRSYLRSTNSFIRKIIVFVVLGLTIQSVFAQEYQYVHFPDSNAVWSEVYWKPISEPYPRWVYNQYALFNEDTVINGMTYHKLFHTNATEITKENSECIGGIREDSIKRILICYAIGFKPDEPYYKKEFLLYRFNIDIGDTIWGYKENIDIPPLEFLTVKSIDTIKIYNSMRKVYSFEQIPWVYWIEGIGNVKGLIFTSGDLPTNGMNNDLICMHQNDSLLFYNSDYDGCVPSFVIDDVALLPNTDVNVYPNPVTNGIVYFENLSFESIELFDLNGSLILNEQIKGLSTYKLDIPELTTGIYTYRLSTKGLIPTMGKLVVE
ncbi:T9SS type A sorting domain-containing protein [Maribellus sediminis]|uniref:T9SS type A sorting domain-containing protein n=1 Tax=Maribellus sediminis TaxID=2696285 RepID=UPI0014319EF5|nr:T9SS type A sorting domain-containing protein [Maribellus sediminis]